MSANRDSLQQNPFKSLATSKTHAADRLPRPLLSPFQAGSTRKPQFAASRLPSYQISDENQDGDRTLPNSGKVDSVSVVSACIILQGGGGRRHRSDKSYPHKKRETSGLIREASFAIPRLASPACCIIPGEPFRRITAYSTRLIPFLWNLLKIPRTGREVNAFAVGTVKIPGGCLSLTPVKENPAANAGLRLRPVPDNSSN